jgi:ATP/maltotriose-dependent transcriptional regulator MalT
LVADAARDWVSPRQAEWIGRLRRNHANLRAALEFDSADPVGAATALRIATDLEHYWWVRGSMSEARHLLDLALASGAGSDRTRARALYVDAYAATLQGDVAVAARLLDRAEGFAQRSGDAVEISYIAQGRGLVAMYQDDLSGAIVLLERALPALHASGELAGEGLTLFLLGTSIGLSGDTERAIEVHRRCLALMEPWGESWNCALALWALGVEAWRQGDGQGAVALERQSLRIKTQLDDQLGIAACLQALAWIEGTGQHGESAAVLFGSADTIWRAIGMSLSALPAWSAYHAEGEKAARRIGERQYQSGFRRGSEMTLGEAIAFGLGEKARPSAADATVAGSAAKLTKRQLEIAHLIADGLSNREIANTLVIAQSTAEGHVEQIFMKLGFTSRSQVAAWIAERRVDHSS